MKSHIGLEHIRSNSKGRITHAVPEAPEGSTADNTSDKTHSPDASELVPVLVHVERDALDALMDKSGR